MEAIANPPAYDRARAAVRYDDIARQLVMSFKYERADNVQGAFRVLAEEKPQVAGRRLVLIDDVLTSGATVDTYARALLRAGAAHVDVLVFARVVAPVRTPI